MLFGSFAWLNSFRIIHSYGGVVIVAHRSSVYCMPTHTQAHMVTVSIASPSSTVFLIFILVRLVKKLFAYNDDSRLVCERCTSKILHNDSSVYIVSNKKRKCSTHQNISRETDQLIQRIQQHTRNKVHKYSGMLYAILWPLLNWQSIAVILI